MPSLWKMVALAGLIGGGPLTAVMAQPAVYFEENFRNYRDTAPSLDEALGISLGNDPIWSQSAEANCRMSASGLIFRQYMPAEGMPANVTSYDALFRFQFNTERERRFELRLRHAQGDGYGDLIVSIGDEQVRLSSQGLTPAVAAEARLSAAIGNRQWRQAAVTVRDGHIRVYVAEDRILQPVLEARMAAAPVRGLNFYGFEDAGFGVSDIVLRAPAPLPDNRITRLLPLVADDDAGYRSGAQQPTVNVAANDVFGATVRIGPGEEGVRLTINGADGASRQITFGVGGVREPREKVDLPDGVIRVRGLDGNVGVRGVQHWHIRPLLRRYHTSYSYTDTFHDIVRDWELLPRASTYPVTVEARRTAGGIDLYFNGRLASRLDGGAVAGLTFTLSPTASIRDVFSRAEAVDTARYLPLDIAALRRARSFADAKASIGPGLTRVNDVPIRVAEGKSSADIGLTKQGQGNWALEVDEYLARSAFDGLLTEVHFAVPAAPYTRAWVLAAVDPDPAKDPILTARLAHYIENGTGNNTLADTTVILPRGDATPGPGVTRVGSVSRPGPDGRPVELPLYLVEVPLPSGQIIDLIMSRSWLNFEFFGKPWVSFQQLDNTSKPDPDSTSAVQVFGVTLEKAPVGLEMVQSQPGNVFHNDETPQTGVIVHALSPAQGRLAWQVLDVEGRPVGEGSAGFSFNAAGQQQRVDIPLAMPDKGWYELLISVQDAEGRTQYTHPASFALLGQDRRRARYDSPYGVWWFDGAHNTPSELTFAGPIMVKAGIRQVGWTGQSEAAMAPWFLTKDQVNMPFNFNDLNNPDAARERARRTMDGHLEKYPHLREVLIFHESGPGNDIPIELIGGKPDPARIAGHKRYADLYNLAGEFFRKEYPQLKTVVGNNSSSQSVVAAIFRHGGNPDYMDYIGQESPSQVFIPEKLQEWAIQGHHIATDTARVLTGRAIPATGCYEFTYRCERDMGLYQQAQWYTRDVLISLANGFTRIGPGILFDASNSYYNGLWGGSGLLQRSPWGYPKPAYVAYATATNVLDQVTLSRELDTGSPTIYALEFNRSDEKQVVALWASRGQAVFAIRYGGDTTVQVIDMFGRTSEQRTEGGVVRVQAGTSPAYVVADRPVADITVAERSFPKDEDRAALASVAAPLDDVAGLTLDDDASLDTPQVAPLQLPIRQRGRFELRQVSDDDRMGRAVEVALDTAHHEGLSRYITEYTTLRLKEPAVVSGEPAALGVWVKGNSNWGRIMFEIEDAGGEVWRSVGTSGWGCDILDWPGNLSVNFDGWSFVALPLRETSLFNDRSPGPVLEQWVSLGGNKRIDYPIKVTALIVEMHREPLRLTDFVTVEPVIRLRDISGIIEPAHTP